MALYFYNLWEDRQFKLPIAPSETIVVKRKSTNQPMFQFNPDGTLVVFKGYAWDGCSPKYKLGPFVFGIWDGKWDVERGGPALTNATLIHDVLIQAKHVASEKAQFSYKDNDKLFLSKMQEANFSMAKLYYAAVRIYDILYFWRK